MRDKILELRLQGFTYSQIQKELGCSKSTIAYHIGEGQKDKKNARQNNTRYQRLLKVAEFKNVP